MASFSKGRQRPADYIAICNNIADSYPFGIAHGLQKDAIQNAVDARRGRSKVRVHFELIENSNEKILTITDSNTIGLTGPVLYDALSYADDLPSDYHWARFESFAFTKDDPDAIGARGQGKFIFLRASSEYTMYYDTLREDEVYRVGATKAKKTGCPILPSEESEAWKGKNGEQEIAKICGLKPIKNIGTRIIIIDPIDEVCKEIKNGSFINAIEETWFRAIEKKILEVLVTYEGKTHYAKLPYPYPLQKEDSRNIKTWILGSDFSKKYLEIYDKKYRIKNFHAVFLNDDRELEENMSGISIIQKGMKICPVNMNSAPPDIRENIVGYIEFDHKLERELRKGINQYPNHYNLKWRRKTPNEIRNYVRNQLDSFGQTKLGLQTDPRQVKNRKRTNAEEWAMRQLLRHASDLDLFGAKGKARPSGTNSYSEPKELGVSINKFTFPNPNIAPRIDWEQKFSDITITAYNKTDTTINAEILTQILHGDSVVMQPIKRQEITLQNKFITNKFDIEIVDDLYPTPGVYRITTSLIDLESGDRLDHVSRKFWVEKDPPLRQPFILQPLPEFPDPFSHQQWYTSGAINSSPTLYYNLSHPAYLLVEGNEDSQAEYILDIVLSGALDFVLKRPNLDDGSPDFHPLESERILGEGQPFDLDEVPSKTYEELSSYISRIRWRIFEGKY